MANCSMKTFAVIVAGGAGNRMGTDTPKQFLELEGKPVLVHTANAFFQAFPSVELIVVLPPAYLEMGRELLVRFFPDHTIHFTVGGATRFHSVQEGLQKVKGPAIIFIHDAVRCVVSATLIRNCYYQALDLGSAIPAVSVKDSIRLVQQNINTVIDRSLLRAVQTPQTFHSDIILPAFQQEFDPAFTDEATVVEKYGQQIKLIEGEESNIKITYPIDLFVAAKILQSRNL
jgi:2-C-methyl-D-erythritol 4-phosphate cytidylyltransferase